MKISSLTKTFLVLCFAVLAAAFCFCASTPSSAANAADITLIYPVDGYIQLNSADYISASEHFVAALDKTAKRLIVGGDKDLSFSLDGMTPNGVYAFGDKVLVSAEEGCVSADLSADSPALASVTLPAPANVSYLTSDGTYLYAHAAGTVVRYDDTLTADGTYNDSAFLSSPVFSADGEKIYLFSVEYGVSKYSVYDIATGNTTKTNSTVTALEASCGDLNFVHNGTSIVAFPKNYTYGDEILFDTEIESAVFAAYGNKLYVALGNEGYKIYDVNSENNGITESASYGMRGSELSRLDSPADVAFLGDTKVVADAGNDRLLFVGASISALTFDAPRSLAASGNRLYAASEHSISIIENGRITATYDTGEATVLDLAYLDELYVLTANKIYTLSGGNLSVFAELTGYTAVAMTATEDGASVYVLTTSGVIVRSTDQELSLIDDTVIGAVDIAADFAGNYYTLSTDNKATKHDGVALLSAVNAGSAIPAGTVIPLDSALYTFTAKRITLGADGCAYFTTDGNTLVKADVSATDKADYVPATSPDITSATHKYYEADEEFFYLSDAKRLDGVRTAPAGEVVLIFDVNSGFSGYEYGVYQGKTVYFAFDGEFTEKTATAINATYIANKGTKLYAFPGSDDVILYALNRTIQIDDDAAGADGGKWYGTTYNGKRYYILRADCDLYSGGEQGEQPEEEKKVYGKAKATRPGGTVGLYEAADSSSAVLTELRDGTEVEVIETLDGYYKVSYGQFTGYVKADELKIGGLTTVQIVAIVLSIVVVLAGTVVFLVTYQTKKKAEEEE